MIKKEIEKKYGLKATRRFIKWMNGQTVAINKKGEYDYYEHDINKFFESNNRIIYD